ncbi:MAG: PhzF family phenazine biosynthesis protein [Candidatus Heimdallarchaeota archaeon]|nr:MAG: PhzF family phenazine biosynthesis protein [Candidatus Heimdallarchaeota archaeon]
MRTFDFIQTSVFTDDRFPFSGNQLATFPSLAENELSTDEMQGITREMNFSETTFVLPTTLEKCIRKVRIFTPGREIPFAGHPTLGTAYVLRNQGIVTDSETEAYLELGIGPIAVNYCTQDHIQMHQARPQFLEEFYEINSMAKILGIAPNLISHNGPMQFVSTGFPFLIVPLVSLTAIQAINLDVNLLLKTLEDYSSQELLVFTPDTVFTDSDAHVRMFAPSAGVPEDPATGSAAGPLGSYLERYQILSTHEKGTEIVLEQGHEIHRPSQLVVQCKYEGDEFSEIIVGGRVKLVVQGKFFL